MSQLDTNPLRWREGVADHARTVVVPLANPDTAVDLLRIARGMLPAEGGRVLGLVVTTDDADAERSREVSDGMQDLVEVMDDRLTGCDVVFRSRSATSVARGILDAIRDAGADAVVLGIRAREEGDEGSRLGPVVESVIETAACDVVVHRPGTAGGLEEVERVRVAVDGDLASRNAVRVATLLRRGLRVDLSLVHVRDGAEPGRRAHARIARSVAELVSEREAELDVVDGEDVVDGLVRAVEHGDLVVVGIGHEDRRTGLAEGSVARGLLDRLDVPVLTVTRTPATANSVQERLRRAAAWLHPRLTDVEQESMRAYADGAAELRLDYLMMTVLSGVIASFGLLLDSAAVIIGAMLVAPLMQPLQAFGIAVVAGRPRQALRALNAVVVGTALVLGVAALCGLAVGVAIPTEEMLSRGSPSVLDAAVALAAGAAGAYATGRKDIPAALAGVAIAAALVPPIGAAGLGVAAGRWGLAAGAGLLFTVNIVCIAVVSAVVFQWMGLRPRDRTRTERGQVALAVGSVGMLFVLLVVLVVVDARRIRIDERPLEEHLAEAGLAVDLAELTVVDDQRPTTVRVVLDVLEVAPEERAGLPDLVLEELREQVGPDVRARVVLRDVIGVD